MKHETHFEFELFREGLERLYPFGVAFVPHTTHHDQLDLVVALC